MSITGIDWTTTLHVREVGPVRLIPSRPDVIGAVEASVSPGTPTGSAGAPGGGPPGSHPTHLSLAAASAAATHGVHVHGLGDLFPTTRRGDLVGFGDPGVWVALSNGDGSFQAARLVLHDLGTQQSWHVDKHPRFVADITGDGSGDLVGFGDAGVYVARSNGDGTYQPLRFVNPDLGVQQGWRVDQHPRMLADLTGDGRADIVGFGATGVHVSLAKGDGTFQPSVFVLADFSVQQGWRVDAHPRFLADVTGDGRADIVGFGDAGVFVARSNGDGTFQPLQFALADFGVQQGWRVDRHPRFLADITGDGRADIVGFGDAGVWVALSHGDGTFGPAHFVNPDLGVQQGWRVDQHPRFLADLTGDGRADIVGFGAAGVHIALAKGDGTFQPSVVAVGDFGVQQGWRVAEHPRFVTDVTGDGRADIVGFGDAGVWVARSNGDGTFQAPMLGIADFGARSGSAGITHVFVLMLENRSFDHLLGFSEIAGTDAETGQPTTTSRLGGNEANVVDGTPYPVTEGAEDVLTKGPGHEFEDVIVQLCGDGAYSAYHGGPYPTAIDASGYAVNFRDDGGDPAEVMKCFRPDQLPILNQLAREFAVCDHWYSSLPGPTFPNRFFMHAASSGGLDRSPTKAENAWWETVDGFDFPKGTIYDRLDGADLRYRFYAGDDLPVVAGLAGVSLWDIHDFDEHFAEDMKDSDYADLRYIHLEPSYDVFNDFKGGTSQHPLGDVNKGELFVKQAYEAIRNSPLWESSLLIITWDEHGGFYDHEVPPPAVPPNDGAGDDYNEHGFLFDRLGPRVPAVIVSPRIPRNVIDHRVYDHASIPAAIERVFGLAPLTDRDRHANAPNALCTLLSPRTDTPATLADVAVSANVASVAPKTPAQLAQPIADPSVMPFVQVAAIEHLKMTTDPAERAAIVANARTIETYGQAYVYMKSVTTQVRATRAARATG